MAKLTYRKFTGRFQPTEREIELMHKLFDEDEEFERDDNIGFFTDYNTGFFNASILEEYDTLGLRGESLRDYYDEQSQKGLSHEETDDK